MRLRYSLLVVAGLLGACSGEKKNQEKMVDLKTVSDKPDAKVSHLTEAIEKEPNNAGLYAQRSRLYLDLKQDKAALADAEKAISLDNSKGEYYFLKAKAQRNLNRLEAALTSAQTAETKNYRTGDLYILMGEINLIIKQYQKAIDYLNQALRLSSFNEYAYFYKGVVYAESGDTARAVSNLQTALEQAPNFVQPYIELAKINTAQKHYREAATYIESGLRYDPGNATLYINQGYNLVAQHYPDSAMASFKRALVADSSMYQATYNLGVIEYNRDRYAQAIPYFEKVLPHAANLPNLNLLLAHSYEKIGQTDAALRQYNIVLQKTPEESFARNAVRRLQGRKTKPDTTASQKQ